MHFLEAHKIVYEFAGAVGRENKSMLIPYSWINYREQEIIDAFIIFFGHMVLWQSRTNEEYRKYFLLFPKINSVISDDLYKLIIDAKIIVEKSEKNILYRMFNRRKLESANLTINIESDLIKKGFDAYEKRIETIDFGAIIGDFQSFVMEYIDKPENERKSFDLFVDDYIYYVYSKTSYKEPEDIDFTCFRSFEDMRNLLDDYDNLTPMAKAVYSEYRGDIISKR